MHRFRLILLPLCLFATATAIGQTVTGRIVDERQQPVAGVAVVMQTPDSVYVDAVASDLEGRFAIASDVRPYRLLFQHLSYDPLTVERSGDDAGTVTLTEATNLVDEVVVRGERPLVKVEQGRLSYDLQVAAQGKIAANAYEALTKLYFSINVSTSFLLHFPLKHSATACSHSCLLNFLYLFLCAILFLLYV